MDGHFLKKDEDLSEGDLVKEDDFWNDGLLLKDEREEDFFKEDNGLLPCGETGLVEKEPPLSKGEEVGVWGELMEGDFLSGTLGEVWGESIEGDFLSGILSIKGDVVDFKAREGEGDLRVMEGDLLRGNRGEI